LFTNNIQGIDYTLDPSGDPTGEVLLPLGAVSGIWGTEPGSGASQEILAQEPMAAAATFTSLFAKTIAPATLGVGQSLTIKLRVNGVNQTAFNCVLASSNSSCNVQLAAASGVAVNAGDLVDYDVVPSSTSISTGSGQLLIGSRAQ
jgi:hypothetical protein